MAAEFNNQSPWRMWRTFFRTGPSFGFLLGLSLLSGGSLRAEIRFNRDVRPILAENCLSCHGPDARQRKAGLRLDEREAALHPARSGEAAVVPGRPEQSMLVRRIETKDEEEVMPPPQSRKELSATDRQVLRQWVAEGAKYEPHWAFIPIARPAVPEVRDKSWPRNAIDRFVLAKLEQQHLSPAPAAPPAMLARRLTYGITGLPPSPEEVSAFINKHDDVSYTALIERLLASTGYGEHWARHWMDVVRYADSAGYELDYLYTHAWRYRDWLVRSFTANKPMDRFIQEQVAGDELWPGNEDAVDGSRFLTIGPLRYEGGIQRAKDRDNEWLTDLADTTGAAFLGLTMGCTRCHDHKFDPITQDDYYGLQAVFAGSELKLERQGVAKTKGDENTRPAFVSLVPRTTPATVQVLRRGEVDLPLRDAVPRFPASLPGGAVVSAGAPRRAALANWLVSPQNPLAARVLMNRVWQWHFGEGLVRTANDFGRQGEPPVHAELLDWLACELMESGWNLGHMQRLILDSATYRQSSLGAGAASPRLLAGFPRQRLQAEALRDAMLSVSGELNLKPFGAPVVPPVEPWALSALRQTHWEPSDASEWNRRSLYLVVRRSIKLPFLEAFNSPDTISSCAGRASTVVASQALTLLNSEDTLARARSLAGRLWWECDGKADQAAARAWLLAFNRPIAHEEQARALKFLDLREAYWTTTAPEVTLQPSAAGHVLPAPALGAAWVEWCLALLNANEFIYVD